MNQQLLEKALKQFQQSAKMAPKFYVARRNQGIALLNLQRIELARPLLEEAVKHNPNDPYAWFNLGLLHRNAGDTQAALDAFRRLVAIDPTDGDTWYHLGSVHLQARQTAEAIAAFERAVKLNPFHASAEFGLARAFQQAGKSEQAKQHLDRFQLITESKSGAPISLAYGEQGKYSLAEESPSAPEPVPPAIRVRFVPVTEQAGLATKPASNAPASDLASFLGSGACFFDDNGDGRVDLLLARGGKNGGIALYRNLGSGRFLDVTRSAGLDSPLPGIGCAAGDYDNDGFTDLAIGSAGGVLLFHNEKDGDFQDVTKAAGIQTSGLVLGLTFIDYDHDGDLDLYVTRYSNHPSFDPRRSFVPPMGEARVVGSNVMWRNNGNKTFTDVTEATALSGAAPSVAVVITDYNNDRAVDFVVTGGKNSPSIFENPREGKFLARQPWGAAMPAAAGVAVFDFNKDGWMDIACTHWDKPGLTLWRNANGRSFESVSLPDPKWSRGWGVSAVDYDNDGWLDLAAVGETVDGRGEIRLFRNLGREGFRDVTAEVGLAKINLKNPRALITGDYDQDGDTDLLITQSGGSVVLLRNQRGNQNRWLRIALKGLNDNKSGIGTKVEVLAGGNRQKWEVQGASGYLGQNSPEITAGLGRATEADVVRMLWPTGVLQDEVQLATTRAHALTEIDRRGSSCPTLFAWDGTRYRLVGDIIGAGVLGHWVGPGERNIPRPTEYVKVDRHLVQHRDGMLSFRLLEPMEEVVYLDQVRLLAVDHPSDFDVYPNEYFASAPPYPEFRVITVREPSAPAGAWDEHGHDVLPDLLANRYFGDFELLSFKGFTKLHTLGLDLGEPYRGGPLRLLLHGVIEYFTATGMYAAAQAGMQAIAPYVEAQDAKGKWIRVIDDMGFPAGLPRTIVADLAGRLPAGTQRIRVSTNLQIYWSRILIDRTEQNLPYRLTSVPIKRADLGFRGYPRQIEDRPPGNVKYIYEEVSHTGPYARHPGTYTRYGDVRPLLAESDDAFVVFGSGEEVALEFDPASLPPLPPNWIRDYFFMANGYEKDMDFYAAQGGTVNPLPFRDMGTYPYPAGKSYPMREEHLNYLLEYNTRHVSGDEPGGFRYNYPFK
ncbi:MAG TPA: FG-GAP-like repeat-containing protein [Terriglobales bacterium]|nr:FG-GAP-like repeat-containing protein [Terriglobales bacterium]